MKISRDKFVYLTNDENHDKLEHYGGILPN